jgi:hypothetical protein
MLYQSQLTGSLVEEIMSSGSCKLPSYKESAHLHKPLLSAYLNHYNSFITNPSAVCPIT